MISPTELHINEPDYYEELYSQHKPRNKSPFYSSQFDLPGATFSAVDYKLHRRRRAALNPFFSKSQINKLQPMLTYMIDKLCQRIDECRRTGHPMPMRHVYMCFTTDVVTLYAVNRSWNHLDSPDFSPPLAETIKAVGAAGALVKQFPSILPIIRALPRELLRKLDPGMVLLLEFEQVSSQFSDKMLPFLISLKR